MLICYFRLVLFLLLTWHQFVLQIQFNFKVTSVTVWNWSPKILQVSQNWKMSTELIFCCLCHSSNDKPGGRERSSNDDHWSQSHCLESAAPYILLSQKWGSTLFEFIPKMQIRSISFYLMISSFFLFFLIFLLLL
jgi:hypothetical protein